MEGFVSTSHAITPRVPLVARCAFAVAVLLLLGGCGSPTRPRAAVRTGQVTVPRSVPASEVLALEMFTSDRGVSVAGPLTVAPCLGRNLPRALCPRTPGPDYLATTLDGGRSWHVTGVLPSTLDPLVPFELHMAFATPAVGYILSTGAEPKPQVELTEDGGRTWSPVHVPGQAVALSLSATTLWVVSDICPAASTPTALCASELSVVRFGARAPNAIRPIPTLGNLAEPGVMPTTRAASLLARIGPGTAVAEEGGEGEPSSMLLTSDTGVHWRQIPDPCGRTTPSSMAALTPTHWVLDCELGGGMNQGDVAIYVSTDGGARWTRTAAANEDSPTLGAVSDRMSYDLTASGDGGVLWLPGDVVGVATSTDGGVDWQSALIDAGGGRASMAVAGATEAWLPVPGEGLYHTVNGTTWTKLP